MINMIEQLKELLEMQRVLDEKIMKEHGIVVYPEENMKIALFVELGELMNEFPTKFKHWKKTAVDNREKGLIEYVDALHFQLSLLNNSYFEIIEDNNNYNNFNSCTHITIDQCLIEICNCDDHLGLSYLLDLGNLLGFTWDEIYTSYKEKNAVNYERLKNGY